MNGEVRQQQQSSLIAGKIERRFRNAPFILFFTTVLLFTFSSICHWKPSRSYSTLLVVMANSTTYIPAEIVRTHWGCRGGTKQWGKRGGSIRQRLMELRRLIRQPPFCYYGQCELTGGASEELMCSTETGFRKIFQSPTATVDGFQKDRNNSDIILRQTAALPLLVTWDGVNLVTLAYRNVSAAPILDCRASSIQTHCRATPERCTPMPSSWSLVKLMYYFLLKANKAKLLQSFLLLN